VIRFVGTARISGSPELNPSFCGNGVAQSWEGLKPGQVFFSTFIGIPFERNEIFS